MLQMHEGDQRLGRRRGRHAYRRETQIGNSTSSGLWSQRCQTVLTCHVCCCPSLSLSLSACNFGTVPRGQSTPVPQFIGSNSIEEALTKNVCTIWFCNPPPQPCLDIAVSLQLAGHISSKLCSKQVRVMIRLEPRV